MLLVCSSIPRLVPQSGHKLPFCFFSFPSHLAAILYVCLFVCFVFLLQLVWCNFWAFMIPTKSVSFESKGYQFWYFSKNLHEFVSQQVQSCKLRPRLEFMLKIRGRYIKSFLQCMSNSTCHDHHTMTKVTKR